MKQAINPLQQASHILTALKSGILLTTAARGRVNTMTISWGTLGIEWQSPIFITFVRTNRFSHTLLETNPEFTINVPYDDYDRRILGIAGTRSGRDIDKISHLNLHLEQPEKISVPGIRELPLTLECVVAYKQHQDGQAIPQDIRNIYYPQHIDSHNPGANKDFHTAYYGIIVAAYLIS